MEKATLDTDFGYVRGITGTRATQLRMVLLLEKVFNKLPYLLVLRNCAISSLRAILKAGASEAIVLRLAPPTTQVVVGVHVV